MAIRTKPPAGTRDFLAPEARRRRQVMETVREVYERHGFAPLETPAMERIETLTGKYGDEGDQLLFRVQKRGDKLTQALERGDAEGLVDFGLRYDLTVPLARVVAEYGGTLPRWYRRYQMQPVWRADRPQRGRFREFYQCDVDFVGTQSVVAEVEVVLAAAEALCALGFTEAVIRVNDRRILMGLLALARVPAELQATVLVILDKLDKIGAEGVATQLAEAGVDQAGIATLAPVLNPGGAGDAATPDGAGDAATPGGAGDAATPDGTGDGRALLETLAKSFATAAEGAEAEGNGDAGAKEGPPQAAAGCVTLRQLFALLDAAPCPLQVRFDPSLARGLSYYTGPIFEVTTPGFPSSIGGGGRYDGLVGMFRGQEIPAVGMSLGIERLLVLLEERDQAPAAPDAEVVVARMDDATLPDALALTGSLRRGGFPTLLVPESIKLGKQFRYAEECGARFCCLLGSREREAGEVVIRDLVAGAQRSVRIADAVDFLRTHRSGGLAD